MAFPTLPNPAASPAEALAGLEAALRQLRESRRRLAADPTAGRSGDDALVYIETAEMHLQAARCRLADALPRPAVRPERSTPVGAPDSP